MAAGGPGAQGREALWGAVRAVLNAQRDAPPLERAARDTSPPASFAQQRLWFLERLAPGSATHGQTVACRLTGPLGVSALERGLAEMVRRHEALRTTLRWEDGRLVQVVHDPAPFALPVEDLEALDAARRDEEAGRGAAREARAPFDLDRAPLLRARLFRLAPGEHVLVLTMHHLAFDGWSFDVFMRELGALHAAFLAGAPSPLAEPAVRYADYAAWQRQWLEGEARAPLLDYWTARMRGPLAVARLPADRSRRPVHVRRGDWQSLAIEPALANSVKRLGHGEGATPFMTFLAAFQVLLYRYTGADDLVVGTPVANRNRAGLEGLVGLFANTLALRTALGGQPRFRELLGRTRDTVLGAYAHQDLPFEMLVEAIRGAQRAPESPLFEVMFAYQNLPRTEGAFPGLDARAWNVGNGTAKFEATLFLLEDAGGLSALLEYDADLFDAASMARLLAHFRHLLGEIVRDPDRSIDALALMSADEERQALLECNDTGTDYPRETPIHRVLEAQARRTPHAAAVVHAGGELTYAQLDALAGSLARRLAAAGVACGDRVAVCLDPSPALVASFLAVLKAGAAYVPVDPSEPGERTARMLRQAAVTAVIADPALAACVAATGVRMIDPGLGEEASALPPAQRAGEVDATSLACVMFTSGSTGNPKGACITHRGVVRLARGANYADMGPGDVFLQLAPVTFDASTFEIWGALLNGATLVLPAVRRPSLQEIGELVRRHRVSVLWLTTGLFELMVDARPADLAGVRQLLTGGDVLSPRHAARFLEQAPGCRLVNCYGPTESTTFATFHPVERGPGLGDERIPIGRPVSNTQVYVLDPLLRPVPPGVAGEACIGGDGLMRGYAGDEPSTRERLVPNPFPGLPGPWLYRSGDIVRRRGDGSLDFIGRIDGQVKIRGFRVEPGGVEALLGLSPLVRSAAVVAHRRASGEAGLVAYVVPASATAAREDLARALRDFLRARLPEWHVPSAFEVVESLPITANGKVDRAALPPPSSTAPPRPHAARPPLDGVERAVARSFERVLGLESLAADDDFFDCGGTSLAALRLVADLEGSFATKLPLASLYEHPTVAGMAAQLRDLEPVAPPAAPGAGRRSNIVEIKRARSGTPLFVVPGGHGGMAEMTLYAQVMSHVRRELPVYGLLARGVDGLAPPHGCVADMADAYVDEVLSAWPRGPYALAGECVGGVVAFEMARRLAGRGREVALLLLMDTWCPSLAGTMHYRLVERPRTLLGARSSVARAGLADVGRVLREHVRDRPDAGPLRSLRYGVNVALTLKRVADPWLEAVRQVGKPAPGAERIAEAESAYVDLVMRHRPRPYGGRVTLLVSADNDRRGLAEGWRRLAGGGLAVHRVPGDHDSYIRGTPEATAERLQACLDEALPERRGARHG